MLRTFEITDIFNTFDEIYLVFTLKKVNILYILKHTYQLSGISKCEIACETKIYRIFFVTFCVVELFEKKLRVRLFL